MGAIGILLGIKVVWDMQQIENLNQMIKYLFYVHIVVGLTMTLLTVICSFPNEANDWLSTFNFIPLFYMMNFIVIYMTLVARIHVAFRGSTLELSTCSKITFGVILVFLICLPLPLLIVVNALNEPDFGFALLMVFLLVLWCCLYPVSAVLATCVFQSKLVYLAKMQRNSM